MFLLPHLVLNNQTPTGVPATLSLPCLFFFSFFVSLRLNTDHFFFKRLVSVRYGAASLHIIATKVDHKLREMIAATTGRHC